jgi:acetoacetyl-CoA synthetase
MAWCYGGREHDRLPVLAELRAQLPRCATALLVGNLNASVSVAGCASWISASGQNDAEIEAFEPLWLPFDHPLWIVYSSGTTGLPKPIVHGHGGMLLVLMSWARCTTTSAAAMRPTAGASATTGTAPPAGSCGTRRWPACLLGTTCVIFDGNPGGIQRAPDWTRLWRFAAKTGVTFFGAGAAFYANCMKAGITAAQCGDLTRIRALGSTGSPLSAEVQQWGTRFMAAAGVDGNRETASGGPTSRGAPTLPAPSLAATASCRKPPAACSAACWAPPSRPGTLHGQPVLDAVGELVCTQPIPSMPLYLWGTIPTHTQWRTLPVQLLRHLSCGPRPPARWRRRPARDGRRLAPRRLDRDRQCGRTLAA